MLKKRIFAGAPPATQFVPETGLSALIGQVFRPAGLEKHGPRIADIFRRLGVLEDKVVPELDEADAKQW